MGRRGRCSQFSRQHESGVAVCLNRGGWSGIGHHRGTSEWSFTFCRFRMQSSSSRCMFVLHIFHMCNGCVCRGFKSPRDVETQVKEIIIIHSSPPRDEEEDDEGKQQEKKKNHSPKTPPKNSQLYLAKSPSSPSKTLFATFFGPVWRLVLNICLELVEVVTAMYFSLFYFILLCVGGLFGEKRDAQAARDSPRCEPSQIFFVAHHHCRRFRCLRFRDAWANRVLFSVEFANQVKRHATAGWVKYEVWWLFLWCVEAADCGTHPQFDGRQTYDSAPVLRWAHLNRKISHFAIWLFRLGFRWMRQFELLGIIEWLAHANTHLFYHFDWRLLTVLLSEYIKMFYVASHMYYFRFIGESSFV